MCNNLFFIGRRLRGISNVPNVMMLQDKRTKRLDPVAIPTVNDAVTNYRTHGGHLTDPDELGVDLISLDVESASSHFRTNSHRLASFLITLLMVNQKCFEKAYYIT